jgi:hypothetical protein
MGKAFGLLAFWCGRFLEGKIIAKGEFLASLRAKTLRKLKRKHGLSESKERGFKEDFRNKVLKNCKGVRP